MLEEFSCRIKEKEKVEEKFKEKKPIMKVKSIFLPLLGGVTLLIIGLLLTGQRGCVEQPSEKVPLPQTSQRELKLSDFPEVFKENTLVVVGDNAPEIELQTAQEIADYLESKTKNKPSIKKYSEVSDKEKKNYNLIVIGTPRSNLMLKEVYAIADVLEVKETFPGKDKGILEILKNPWNEERAMLLIEGWDVKGIRTKVNLITTIRPPTLNEMSEIVKKFVKEKYQIDPQLELKSEKFSSLLNLTYHNMFWVHIPTQPPSKVLVAVGLDGNVLFIPAEFNTLAERDNIIVDNQQKAWAIVNLFLPDPPYKILESTKDIPYYSRYRKDPKEYAHLVSPPLVKFERSMWNIDLFTWNKNNGAIEKWQFNISLNGEVKSNQVTIAKWVGDYIGLE